MNLQVKRFIAAGLVAGSILAMAGTALAQSSLKEIKDQDGDLVMIQNTNIPDLREVLQPIQFTHLVGRPTIKGDG